MTRLILTLAACMMASTASLAQNDPTDDPSGYETPIPGRDVPVTYAREYEGLKPGRGREETYFAFAPCLKVAWIKEQKLSLEAWRAEVPKMADQCGLGELGSDEFDVITNYLATNYGPR